VRACVILEFHLTAGKIFGISRIRWIGAVRRIGVAFIHSSISWRHVITTRSRRVILSVSVGQEGRISGIHWGCVRSRISVGCASSGSGCLRITSWG
jgi:hypothetical protein